MSLATERGGTLASCPGCFYHRTLPSLGTCREGDYVSWRVHLDTVWLLLPCSQSFLLLSIDGSFTDRQSRVYFTRLSIATIIQCRQEINETLTRSIYRRKLKYSARNLPNVTWSTTNSKTVDPKSNIRSERRPALQPWHDIAHYTTRVLLISVVY